jgi:thiol:disulfide interchange protein DsbA
MFQRAYITAQALGIADKVHEEVFDAIWRTGEIPLVNPTTKRINARLPTIEDAARFYAKRTDVKEADFVAASKSFAVETRIAQAEKLMRAYRVDSTPTFVVAGKYKVNGGSYDDIIATTKYLVDRELASAPAPAAAPAPQKK